MLLQGYFHILYSIGKEEQLQLCLGINCSFVEINKIISFSVGQSSIVFKHRVWVNSRLFSFRDEIINCFPPLNVPGLSEMTSPAHSSKLCIWLVWQKLSNDLNMVQFVEKNTLKNTCVLNLLWRLSNIKVFMPLFPYFFFLLNFLECVLCRIRNVFLLKNLQIKKTSFSEMSVFSR